MTISERIRRASSLSRLWKATQEHDTGTITAFRNQYTHKENIARNGQLLAALRAKYNVTQVQGTYVENYGQPDAVEVKENTFFVVDHQDKGTLEADLRRLGAKFDQDSVLYIVKGGADGRLWGTNKTGYPGFGVKKTLQNPVFGVNGEFMTKVHGRPFVLKAASFKSLPCDYPRGFFGEWGRSLVIDDRTK